MLGMCPSYMFLHRAVPFFLHSKGNRQSKLLSSPLEVCKGRPKILTPRHLFLQLEPSWLVNGQTTSLLASDAEKELVREDLGGMAGRGRCSGTRRGLGEDSCAANRLVCQGVTMHEPQIVSAMRDAIESTQELDKRSRGERQDERLLLFSAWLGVWSL